MCGIVGGTNFDWNFNLAVNLISHRGPDSQKIFGLEKVVLGFSRLAIIDVSNAADQPMSSEDGQVWIVFNGEIYGFQHLRDYLKGKGYKFRTSSDTEVLLNAYLEWGDCFVERLDGMFAMAIYDSRNQTLRLFRDRVGIKPLYYFYDRQEFAFASELKSIVSLCSNHSLEYDVTALYDYLTYKYIPEPKTLYKNIFKLPPAHTLIFDLDRKNISKIDCFWRLEVNPEPQAVTIDATRLELKQLVTFSVEEQLVADVPVGFFLSGGIDSSVVVAEAAQIQDKLKTFSIGFDSLKDTETHFAEEVATLLNTSHYVKTLSRSFIDENWNKLNQWYDEPFADTSAFPTYAVAELARQHVTVVLTGDGGDEIFGGYRWYEIFKNAQRLYFPKTSSLKNALTVTRNLLPRKSLGYKVLKGLELLTNDDLEFYAKLLGGMTTEEKKLYAQEWEIPQDYDSYWFFRQHYRRDLAILTRLQYLDFHTYLPGDVLTKVDRATMAVSLEARVPLLNKQIIEFVFNLPEEIRFFKRRLKGLLKETYKTILPKSVINRSKKGFGIPVSYVANDLNQQEKALKLFYK
jgi:asparagine synthase (glutamine-hydrolysing)